MIAFVLDADDNRTYVELKCGIPCCLLALLPYDNRTYVELKYDYTDEDKAKVADDNRTYVELKYRFSNIRQLRRR